MAAMCLGGLGCWPAEKLWDRTCPSPAAAAARAATVWLPVPGTPEVVLLFASVTLLVLVMGLLSPGPDNKLGLGGASLFCISSSDALCLSTSSLRGGAALLGEVPLGPRLLLPSAPCMLGPCWGVWVMEGIWLDDLNVPALKLEKDPAVTLRRALSRGRSPPMGGGMLGRSGWPGLLLAGPTAWAPAAPPAAAPEAALPAGRCLAPGVAGAGLLPELLDFCTVMLGGSPLALTLTWAPLSLSRSRSSFAPAAGAPPSSGDAEKEALRMLAREGMGPEAKLPEAPAPCWPLAPAVDDTATSLACLIRTPGKETPVCCGLLLAPGMGRSRGESSWPGWSMLPTADQKEIMTFRGGAGYVYIVGGGPQAEQQTPPVCAYICKCNAMRFSDPAPTVAVHEQYKDKQWGQHSRHSASLW